MAVRRGASAWEWTQEKSVCGGGRGGELANQFHHNYQLSVSLQL